MSTSNGELACIYAAVILQDEGIPITSEKIATLVKSANVAVESYWPRLFAKLAAKTNLDDLIMNSSTTGNAVAPSAPVAVAVPAAAAAAATSTVEEKKKKDEPEESDDDVPLFDLFA